MSNAETFHNITSGFSKIVSTAAIVVAGIWAYKVFPDLSDAKRGWPGHPSVDGCVAIRTPSHLKGKAYYAEAGLTITNNTGNDVVVDSVSFTVLRGDVNSGPSQPPDYDLEDERFVTFQPLHELDMVVKPGHKQAPSGFVLRSKETKHYWRGLAFSTAGFGLLQFRVQAFVHSEAAPFGFGRSVWLDDPIGKCGWNSSPV